MIVLIAGATHTGKTVLAQQLLEKYRYPYLSIDHLKMGLIRSGQTAVPQVCGKKPVPTTSMTWQVTTGNGRRKDMVPVIMSCVADIT